jgi:hypothetical protein
MNKPGGNTILLIGDSHAGSLSKVVISVGEKSKVNTVIWTHSGCPLLINKEFRNITPTQRDVCNENFKRTLSWISRNKPDLVLVSVRITSTNQVQDFEEALRRLSKLDTTIVGFQQVPTFPSMGPYFEFKSIAKTRDEFIKAFPIREFKKSEKFRKITDDVLGNLNIEVIPVWPLFCDYSKCSRFLNGDWLYVDDNHLSVEGAELLTPEVESVVTKLLKSQS